jgi:phage shock protein PspC (stress-responsive transcriptional regulator)
MNKIIQINLEGQAISIDEVAFNKLENYLNLLENHFKGTPSGDEILTDIRSRLSELFASKTKTPNTFISEADVQQAIELMGKPADLGIAGSEDFGPLNEDNSENTKQASNASESSSHKDIDEVLEEAKKEQERAQHNHSKKLFRDPDDKALGGVCSGLAAYFNVDVSIIRIATILLVVFGVGFPIPLYLILWAILPEAKTAQDKFRMRGETPDIGEIADRIRNEAKDVADHLKKNSSVNSALGSVAQIIEKVVRAVSKIFGAGILSVMVLFGVVLTIVLLANATGNADININGNLYAAPRMFDSSWVNWLFNVSLLSIILIPIATICYTIVQFIFNFSSPVNFKAIFISWLLALVVFISISIFASNQINYNELYEFRERMEQVSEV